MKNHVFFKDIDFTIPMNEVFHETRAPFLPEFNQNFDNAKLRESSVYHPDVKAKNILGALFQKKESTKLEIHHQKLSFDDEHFENFLKQDKIGGGVLGNERLNSPKRKR